MKEKIKNLIIELLGAKAEEITDISMLKNGMTNHSFLFNYKNEKYIIRIPGEGTDKLINRRQEMCVYNTIKGECISDDVVYMDSKFGYKITRFWENARVCDSNNKRDVQLCMKRLRGFHEKKLKVDHEFDVFAQILFYESLWNNKTSIYQDYEKTKENVLSLQKYVETCKEHRVLTHIDAVPDNFLFIKDSSGNEDVRLIDWEYAGMQDPHIDIAMFCIYAMYNQKQTDSLIDLYFTGGCKPKIRTKIYCYIAICGLLWSNWCEYKRQLGIEFGEYSFAQYRFAKDYYQIAKKILNL